MNRHSLLVAVAALGLSVALGQLPARAGWLGLGDSSSQSTTKEKKSPAKQKKASSSWSKASASSASKKGSGGGSSWFGGLFSSKKPAPTKKVPGPASSGASKGPKQDKESSSPLASLFGKKS